MTITNRLHENARLPAAGVVIAGGGVAALECLMALRDHAGPDLPITLLAPEDDFVYRPLQVAEPFSLGHARRYPLAELARDFGAAFVRDGVAEVHASERRITCESGDELPYEALVLALGAKAEPAFEHGITFGQDTTHEALHGLLADLEQGYVQRVAFVVPGAVNWSLPLYELAVMTAREVWAQGMDDVQFTIVTPEERPLAVFGIPASDAIAALLAATGIEFLGSTYAEPRKGELRLSPDGGTLKVDRVVSLPVLRGRELPGVPSGADGFIPTDTFGRVAGLDGVYAAGDGIEFPIKQGGLATQQADAVAESVAASFGAHLEPTPFRPVLRGQLFTGGGSRFMKSDISGGEGPGTVTAQPLWWPPTKVAGLYLAPYLFQRDGGEVLASTPEGFTDMEIAVGDSQVAVGG